MDIPVKEWVPGKEYSVDDIVKVWNLALPPYLDPNNIDDKDYFAGKYVKKLGDDEKNYVVTDQQEYIATEISRGEIFTEKTISKSSEIAFGLKFPVNPKIGYTAKTMIRKNHEESDVKDPFLTHIQVKDSKIDIKESIGVGIGIKFYDSDLQYIEPENHRMTVRPMASNELSHTEWYKVQLDIEPKFIPDNAKVGEVFIFVYGAERRGFDFREVEATNLNKFFYCKKDNTSSPQNMPGDTEEWTQEFWWRPSYGSSSTFAAINESMVLGEGSDYVNNLAINSLPMQLQVSFKNRTDKEAKAIVHFLQEKHFAYESIFALDYKGQRLLSSDVQSFDFVYTHPYRKDLKFTCTDFNHAITYRNNNTVNATFVCNTESSVRSVDSHSGYNDRIDGVFPAYIDKTTHFVKGKKMKLNSFSLEEGEDGGDKSAISLEGLVSITPFGDVTNGIPQAGLLKFRKDQDLKVGDCIYVNVLNPEDSIYSIGLGKIFKVIDSKNFVFGKGKGYVDGVLDSHLLSEGSLDDIFAFGEITTDQDISIDTDKEDTLIANVDGDAPVEIKKLFFCPENCLTSQPILPDTECGRFVNHKVLDPTTGDYRKRVLFLKNYRQLQLESDIDKETYSIDVTPLSNFTLEKEDDFQILIPAICGRSSIYMEDPDRIPKYPWLKIRNFEQRPSIAFNLSHKPKGFQSNFLKFYNKKYKKSINQNMSTFNVVFDKRDDEEAAEILQFLESHLGYKKFRFTMPRPYLGDSSELTTQSRPFNSVFYCPSWDHQLVYKNNHTINATFIESATGLQENFGDPEGPCIGAKVYNPVTEHSLCTFSSVATAVHQKGLKEKDGAWVSRKKSKETDILFIVDGDPILSNKEFIINSGDGTQQRITKLNFLKDVLLKMIVSHDAGKMPGTNGFGGIYNAPALNNFVSLDGDSNVPPWPTKEDGGSIVSLLKEVYAQIYNDSQKNLEDELSLAGYNLSNFNRFEVRLQNRNVNIGFILMGHTEENILDISDYPDSFDKFISYDKINSCPNSDQIYAKDINRSFSAALAQLYNSRRAHRVDQRIVFVISDFFFSEENNDYVSEMIASLKGGSLAKRRPLDSELRKFGFNPSGTDNVFVHPVSPFTKLKDYGFPISEYMATYAKIFNPDYEGVYSDLGQSNPEWYSENIDTKVIPCPYGAFNGTASPSVYSSYAYDYDPLSRERPQFLHEISSDGMGSKESQRTAEILKITSQLLSDNGFNSGFSITIKNCGPNPIKLKNSIINVDSEEEELKWTVEEIEGGIPKDNDMSNFKYLDGRYPADNTLLGHGGQYFSDPNNKKLFSNARSNLLWHNFNTKYEVYRNGKIHEINGGWQPEKELFFVQTDNLNKIILDSGEELITDPIAVGDIRTKGVLNDGIARRGFPVRVSKTQEGLQIIDYNIGNVSELNDYKGDYSHLPILNEGEVLDLFFGVSGELKTLDHESFQIIINSEDIEDGKMDCYAEFLFKVFFDDGDSGEDDQKEVIVPPLLSIDWDFTVNNPCDPNPWQEYNDVVNSAEMTSSVRYELVGSSNCGQGCGAVQAGTGTATIIVGPADVNMKVDAEGIAEVQDEPYDQMTLKLNGEEYSNELISDLKGFTYKQGCVTVDAFLPRVGNATQSINEKSFKTNLDQSDNYWNPRFQNYAGRNPKLKFLTGRNTNRSREVVSHNKASGIMTVQSNFPFAPEPGDRFIIEGSHINRKTDRSAETFVLKANKTYTFTTNFSTNDHLFHLDDYYYQIDLTFTKV